MAKTTTCEDCPRRRWKFMCRLEKGDLRLWKEVSTGRYAVADESGYYPEDTEDGILWLVPDQTLTLRDERLVLLHVIVQNTGELSRTATTWDGALRLAEMLRWTVTLQTRGGRKFVIGVAQGGPER